MPIKFADTAKPNNTTTATGKGTFPVAKADDVWFNDGDSLEEKLLNGDLGGSDSIQVTELPEASEENQETILQYIGDSDDNYTNGLFYQCVVGTDDDGNVVYKWVEKEVQNSIKVSQEAGNLITLKEDGIFAEQKASSVDCIACEDIWALSDAVEGQYYYNIADGLIYLITGGSPVEVDATADEIEITKELYAILSDEQKELDVTWFVDNMENPFDQVDVTSAVINKLKTDYTDAVPEVGSTNYVTSNGIADAIVALKNSFNPRTEGFWVLANDVGTLTSNKSYTANHDGLLRVHFVKLYSGNTIKLTINDNVVDLVPNYGGDRISETMSGVLEGYVRNGDSIVISCDGGGGNWYVQNVLIQKISWFKS